MYKHIIKPRLTITSYSWACMETCEEHLIINSLWLGVRVYAFGINLLFFHAACFGVISIIRFDVLLLIRCSKSSTICFLIGSVFGNQAQEIQINLTTLLTWINYVLWVLTCADLRVVGCEPQNYWRSEFYNNWCWQHSCNFRFVKWHQLAHLGMPDFLWWLNNHVHFILIVDKFNSCC